MIGFVCCFFNAVAVGWLWYLRKDDPQWLLMNLFSAGLVNAFTGLLMTFVNIYGVPGATLGTTSTQSTLGCVHLGLRCAHRDLRPEAHASQAAAQE